VIRSCRINITREDLVADSGDEAEHELIYVRILGGTRRPNLVLYFAALQGRVECVRIEIGAEFLPGEEPTRLGARFAPIPRPRPLDTPTLRGIKLHTEIKRARRTWLGELEEIAKGRLFGQTVPASARQEARRRLEIARETARYDRPGPAHLGKDHFQRVALIYRDAYERGEPPTLAVSEHFRVPHSTAGRWVSIARNEYSLLPKTRRGKAKARTTRRSPSESG